MSRPDLRVIEGGGGHIDFDVIDDALAVARTYLRVARSLLMVRAMLIILFFGYMLTHADEDRWVATVGFAVCMIAFWVVESWLGRRACELTDDARRAMS